MIKLIRAYYVKSTSTFTKLTLTICNITIQKHCQWYQRYTCFKERDHQKKTKALKFKLSFPGMKVKQKWVTWAHSTIAFSLDESFYMSQTNQYHLTIQAFVQYWQWFYLVTRQIQICLIKNKSIMAPCDKNAVFLWHKDKHNYLFWRSWLRN